MDKVKVNKKMFDALETGIEAVGKNQLLKDHSSLLLWEPNVYSPLSDISTIELAEMLIKGYEVEETPEEKLLSVYKDSKENYPGEINFRNGIMVALNVLNINIRGINE